MMNEEARELRRADEKSNLVLDYRTSHRLINRSRLKKEEGPRSESISHSINNKHHAGTQS